MKVRIPKNNNNKGKSINGIEKLIDIYTNQILEELERKGSTIIRKIDVFSYMLQNKYLKIIVNISIISRYNAPAITSGKTDASLVTAVFAT